MEKVTGGVFILIVALVFAGRCQNDFRQMYSGRATLNAPTMSSPSEHPSPIAFNGDATKIAEAMDAVKPIATGKVIRNGRMVGTKVTDEDRERADQEKIRIVSPLVLNALTESPKPIPPEQITSQMKNETDFCPGVPVRKCPCSDKGACTPLQLMPATIAQFAKPGENPETLLDSLKIAVRHLAFAKGKGNVELDPASDAAILRYNASTDYLNSIRATQAKHASVWSSIKTGSAPIMANTAASSGTGAAMAATSAPVNRSGFMPMIGHPEKQLRTVVGIDGTPTATPIAIGEGYLHSIMFEPRDGYPHGGNDVAANESVIIAAGADGVVQFADWNHKTPAGERAGIHVLIEHNIGSKKPGQLASTSYMHCLKPLVAAGQKVQRGEPVALVGRTAVVNSETETHLHFQATMWKADGTREIAPLDMYFDFSRHDPHSSLYAGPNTDAARSRAKHFEELARHGTT